jgi:signal transduction histidine kinase
MLTVPTAREETMGSGMALIGGWGEHWYFEPVAMPTQPNANTSAPEARLRPPAAESEIAPQFHPVMSNRAALTQTFLNLPGNARKFVPPARTPRIRVWEEVRDQTIRPWFADNGLGVPPHQQERIFQMFYRLPTRYEGAGVGLALVKKVVERMRGSVGVESTVGQGSRFWIELERPKTIENKNA